MHIQLAAIQEEINQRITTASQMGANQHNFLLLKFLLYISKIVARTKNHFHSLFPTSRLTRTMTINQAITRCKCNALNIFQTFTLHIFCKKMGELWSRQSPSGALQFIWKLNLRQICADSWLRFLLQLPRNFSVEATSWIGLQCGFLLRLPSLKPCFARWQATLHSFLSSCVNFGSLRFVGGPENFNKNIRQ